MEPVGQLISSTLRKGLISMVISAENSLRSSILSAKGEETRIAKKMWSIGGGKGGTGKSFVTLSLGIRLAKMGRKVVIIDADLGGANQHTLLGIRYPQYTLNDFIKRRVANLNEVCIETSIPNLKLISGGDDILYLSNPKFTQKTRILKHLNKLEADCILLDLGAGSSFNVLDFFIYTEGKIVVLSPFPTSIQNAYGFLKTALYRRFNQLFSKNKPVLNLVKESMDPESEKKIHSIIELVAAVDKIDQESASFMFQEIEDFKIKIIVNMTKSAEDEKVGEIIKTVADKFLGITVDVLKPIAFDKKAEESIVRTNPLLLHESGSSISLATYEIASELLKA